MKTRKALPIIFVLLVVILYSVLKPNRNIDNQSPLLSSLSSVISRHRNGEIPVVVFMEITKFSWDRVFFFEPYTHPSSIDDVLGFFWLESRFTTIESNDGITLIVFVDNRHVVQHLEFPRNLGDFASLNNKTGYSPESAKFVLNQNGQVILAVDK